MLRVVRVYMIVIISIVYVWYCVLIFVPLFCVICHMSYLAWCLVVSRGVCMYRVVCLPLIVCDIVFIVCILCCCCFVVCFVNVMSYVVSFV